MGAAGFLGYPRLPRSSVIISNLGFPLRPDPCDLLMTESWSAELRVKVGYVNCLCISHYHRAVWRQCRFSKDLMNKQPATAGGIIYIVNAYMCIINMHLYVFK